MSELPPVTRRTLIGGAALLTGASALSAAFSAQAAGTVPQTVVKYKAQSTIAGQQCSKCQYFLPGAKADGPGACKQVAGVIAPTGWCTMYAAKHA
jgi:hypothetical protein